MWKKWNIKKCQNVNLVRKYKRKKKNEILLRRVTTSLSLKNYLPPPERYAKKVTANISQGYNETQKPLFV
jgi:hypothetical protein